MDYVDRLLDQIAKGLAGNNIGISTGLDKFDEIVAGVQKATIYNIAAGQGVGKTSFVLYSFLYQPLKVHLDTGNFKIIYFSLEMSGEILMAKLLSLYIYDTFNREISYKKLISRTKKTRLTEEENEIVAQCVPWLRKVEQCLIIYDKALTCDGVYAFLKSFADNNGSFEETPNGLIYKANNPNLTVMSILDHVALLKRKNGQSTKDAIDSTCSELIYFRNKCGFSSCILQQLNRTSESMDRRKAEMQETELQDLKDSAGPSEAADVVVSIFFPHRSKLTTYRGYRISKGFQEAFRSIIVLKNRYGETDFVIPLNFFGSIGMFRELDTPDNYDNVTDYEPYIHLFPLIKINNNLLDQLNSPEEGENFYF